MTSAVNTTSRTSKNRKAQKVLRTALESTYRFPASFVGFRANVIAGLQRGDDESYLEGRISVTGRSAIEVETEGPEEVKTWVLKEFHSMMSYRWRPPYAYAENTLSMEGDPASLLGCRIEIEDDSFKPGYRIRDGAILEWSNSLGPIHTCRQILCNMRLPNGTTLPETYTVILWSTMANRMVAVDTYSDRCEMVGDIVVPLSRRRVSVTDEGECVYELKLSNWELL